MHAVYYVRPGDNEELRYSLRSLENHSDVDEVTVVGGYPDWLNVELVRVLPGNPYAYKQLNGIHNMETAIRETPGDFVVFNDDFMVLKDLPDPLPYYHKFGLTNHIAQVKSNALESHQRREMMVKMNLFLKSHGVPTPNSFETHIPMRINGERLSELIEKYREWAVEEPGTPLMWRTLYGNHAPLEETQGRRDVITHGTKDFLSGVDFASTADYTVDPILPLLQERFPNPSRWEL